MTQASPLRLVIFDVDGTLIDSQAHIMAAMTHAFDALDQPCPPREAVLSVVGLSLPVLMPRLAPGLDAKGHTALVEAYKNSFADIRVKSAGADMSPLFPGAGAAVERLLSREDMLVGLATGKSRRGLDHLLKAHGFAGRFVTEQVADHHPSKPHPSMLLTALAETGCEAANGVMIGDTSFDIEMGRAAGFRTIGVTWGYHPREALEAAGADQVIEEYGALEGALERAWEA